MKKILIQLYTLLLLTSCHAQSVEIGACGQDTCTDFDVTEATDFTTCTVTLTATGGTQPYNWTLVQIEFPNVTISGDTATFNQCEINGGVGSGTIDSNVFDANRCNKVVRVTYNTDAACCDINLTCDDCTNSCPAPVYEIDDFEGSAANSTNSGNGSGIGCVYYGFSTPNEIPSGDTYEHCVSYTANTTSANFPLYMFGSDANCWGNQIDIYDSNCTPATGLSITQPNGVTNAGSATGLVADEDYIVCYTLTNICATEVDIYEFCTTVSETAYCDSDVNPPNITVNSGQPITLPLGTCVFDPDAMLVTGVSGYAVYFYAAGGGTYAPTFPSGLVAGDIGSDAAIQLDDCNNTNEANGGGCNDITLAPIVNTTGVPIVIGVGVVNVDVSTTCGVVLSILPDCPIYTTTITVLPAI